LVLGRFLFLSLSVVLQTFDFSATSKLFSIFLLFLDFRTYCLWIFYTLFTLILLRHQGGVFDGFSILCLPFVLLRQKGGVFFVLDWESIFKTGQVIFVPEWPKGEFVSF